MTIDERLEALTQSLELLVHFQADSEARQAAAAERHDRDMEDMRRADAAIRASLRRAVAAGVREARNARRRRQELEEKLDEKITQLAAAQLVTEEKLQQFINSMRRGGNGNPSVQ